jgi:hypothetical protein
VLAYLKLLPWAGWGLAALLFWLWLGVREDLAAEIERCNSDKLASIAAAEQITREAVSEAAERRLSQLRHQLTLEQNAREVAEETARLAESRPVEVREIIRRVADENLCLDTAVPDELVDALRL